MAWKNCLDMNGPAIHRKGSFFNRFAHSRMTMAGSRNIFCAGPKSHSGGNFMN
jgi:hypothetical protein